VASFAVFSASDHGALAYLPGSVSTSGFQFGWFDRQGKILGVAGEPSFYFYPAISPSGTQLVTGRVDVPGQIIFLSLLDFARGTNTRFTFGKSIATTPIWSHDGTRIIFSSEAGGHLDLYQRQADGARPEELLLKAEQGSLLPIDISPDGRYLLYVVTTATNASDTNQKAVADLWVLPLEGNRKPAPFLQTEFCETDGHFSPDGNCVAYMSAESGRFEIYVRPFSLDSSGVPASTGAKWLVSTGGGQMPRWGRDGKELYFLTPDWKVMAVDVTTSPVFKAGTPKLLFQAPPQAQRTLGDYTLDGQRFLFVKPAAQGSLPAFNIVLNWPSLLKR